MMYKCTSHINRSDDIVYTIWVKEKMPSTFKAYNKKGYKELILFIFNIDKDIKEIRIK